MGLAICHKFPFVFIEDREEDSLLIKIMYVKFEEVIVILILTRNCLL